jgi:hypothetical protein
MPTSCQALAYPNVRRKRQIANPQLSRAGKVLSILVEADCHDAVCGIERFFDTVAVMYVNIDVQDAIVIAEQLEYPQDDIFVVCK